MATDPARSFGLVHSYADQLPELCIPWQATGVAEPRLCLLNQPLANELGWPPLPNDSAHLAQLLVGHGLPAGAKPVAQGYAGHQFGGYAPRLGDGRALLLGEVMDAQGQWRDVALKGSGRTPFSRGGDGKAALGPMLREYLVSESMHALGIPTTRSLAVVATGEAVQRDGVTLPGAVLTRVAASHLRVGTFEWVAASGDTPLLQRLADYAIARHAPHLTSTPAPYLGLLAHVCERQAALVAQWMGVGFVHGVMNTDNMTISGETIDYGPCAFMEGYDSATVFSSIDHGGRYAYGRQPAVAQWNLARLAESLLPLIHADAEEAVALATEVINGFAARYQAQWLAVMQSKLGMGPTVQGASGPEETRAEDLQLINDWLTLLQWQRADWTLAHRGLSHAVLTLEPDQPAAALVGLRATLGDAPDLEAWLERWLARLRRNAVGGPAQWAEALRRFNPVYIARNQRVEEALGAATETGDLGPFETLLSVVQQPFTERAGLERYTQPETVAGYRTFCGT